MSNSLQSHGLQHAKLTCLSLFPRVCSNLCPLSLWWYPTVSPSVTPFSYCLQSYQASGTFPMSWIFTSGGQSIGASVSSSVLPMNIQDWFPLGLIGRKALKLFVVTTVPCEWQKPSAKDMCLTACPPHPPKAPIYWSPPCLFGALSQSYLKCCFLINSPHFAPNKT